MPTFSRALRLALSFDSAEKMMQALDSLQFPAGSFSVEDKDSKTRKPVAVYIAPDNKQTALLAR